MATKARDLVALKETKQALFAKSKSYYVKWRIRT